MKKLVLSILFLLTCFILQGQCPPGNVYLHSQEAVDNFALSYPNCTEISENFRLALGSTTTSTDISDLSPLNKITTIGGFAMIRYNDNLTNLNGLENLTTIEGDLRIQGNNNLLNLSGLEGLTTIGGHFSFYENSSIINFEDLQSLTSIGLELYIASNGNLISLDDLENVAIGGNVRIFENDNLTNLNGLENLTTIEGDLWIQGNDNLVDLSALENLISIESDLVVVGNESLTSLSSLANLTLIGGRMQIQNTNFITLNDLNNVISIGGQLSIWSNPLLSVCHIPAICNHLENGGLFSIFGNTSSCNSIEEILALCTVSTTTPDNLPQITVSPNPSKGIFQVNGIPQGTYQIHDTTGRIIQIGNMQNDLSIDISQEARGVYFMSIQIENETITKRIIKM